MDGNTYQVTILELHEFFGAFIFVDRVIIGHDAFAVEGRLWCGWYIVRLGGGSCTSSVVGFVADIRYQ